MTRYKEILQDREISPLKNREIKLSRKIPTIINEINKPYLMEQMCLRDRCYNWTANFRFCVNSKGFVYFDSTE